MRTATWAWQFLKDLRDAYIWHRRTGETRRLRATASAWRTALVLASEQSNGERPKNSLTNAEFEWRPAQDQARRVDGAAITHFAKGVCLSWIAAWRAVSKLTRRLKSPN
jgi:hypothetical protein